MKVTEYMDNVLMADVEIAHWIRRPATTFHRACASLSTRSRWCLTGTPIQNSLEDIGALFVFLRAEPFHSLAQFRRFIVVPFQEGEFVVKERLVMLYQSLVIQRTKDLLDLPGGEETTKELHLSVGERSMYERTARILARRLQEQINHKEAHTRFGLFQIHLQLRLLCNHGTYQNLLSWTRGRRVLDNREAFLAEVGFNAERPCIICRQPRPILASRNIQHDFVERCAHIICSECSEDIFESGDRSGSNHCPLCHRAEKSTRGSGSGGVGAAQEDVEMQDTASATDMSYFNPNGVSTKVTALVKDVKAAQEERIRGEGARLQQTKSIIFSCWTRTLDLIQSHLDVEKIEYLRIDGQSLLSRRQAILKQFSSKRGPHVLLMTTGTGAYGLNLTAANRIFIVELQWNPSVERQAIARAIRINQKDKVLVTRYMMLGTVEQVSQVDERHGGC
jgi:SWI/SNF-related matrix-associated actin-dependent regulator of chromatin subfamily A3